MVQQAQTTIYVYPATAELLREVAEADDRTMAATVDRALRQYAKKVQR